MGKASGNLKRNRDLIYVGDIVDFDIDKSDMDGDCVIHRVIERNNNLNRPPVSNLDTLVVVFSLKQPDVNYPVIDKLIAGAVMKGIEPLICITKTDLASEEELEVAKSAYKDVYPTVLVNGLTGEGTSELLELIRGKRVALAGPSGVGKSTITNHILKTAASEELIAYEKAIEAETGEISDKTGRGRHTTRHVEIFPLGEDTMLYDTPGFTSLDMPEYDVYKVRDLLPEFRDLQADCRYADCLHINEPDCAVKEALDEGKLARSRYDSYLIMTEEVKKWQK
jgi:ribosome biogenesis GTPase